MVRNNKILIRLLSLAIIVCLSIGYFTGSLQADASNGGASAVAAIRQIKADFENDISKYFDSKVYSALPDAVDKDQEISVIVSMSTKSVIDGYNSTDFDGEAGEYAQTKEAQTIRNNSAVEREKIVDALNKAAVSYEYEETYDNVLSGFSINITASDFSKVESVLNKNGAKAIVSEVYEPAKYEVVKNDVEVDSETGIFTNTTDYNGDGVVVAILDTGLDYTHTAFTRNVGREKQGADRFTYTAFDGTPIAQKVSSLQAAKTTKGLTGQDVFINRKVPYAYDYADKDSDVFPINSEHGTHVAGIIAGEDEKITGVATQAQLAIMKVFSDSQDGAKTSWLLAALEDCVNLQVDVINMSLGSGCGFTREVDEWEVYEVYEKVRLAGISLIASAANSYNATMGSKKNGNNGLTSNPDSGTVGSPSTYPAALSIASVDGVMTPYFLHEGNIMYFKEASTSDNAEKDFVSEILKKKAELDGVDSYDQYEFEYDVIPGIGASGDYNDGDHTGKIALVKRGTNTFEDKVKIAIRKGYLGVIIYNNVSGMISMSVGDNIGAVCSLTQDDGEELAKSSTKKLKISKSQVAGPFMSDFSSWGPTSDLKIKPELTGHGGEILSSVPGQEYEKLSGTSMAAPNVAGATALVRQYVKNNEKLGKGKSNLEVTAIVNQLMMSTADIVLNKNGLPYAVRKQGAGLISLTKATNAESYILTKEGGKDKGDFMDKSKLELGDDKNRTGVYDMTFYVRNISDGTATYRVSTIVQTEGVDKTFTGHGGTTVSQEGYKLDGDTEIISVKYGGTVKGDKIKVESGATAEVKIRITLSEADKAYLDKSFENGMYVEGFAKLSALDGTKYSLNVPFLAFYGDWMQAPIFDEEYFDTNKDELNAGIDENDKVQEDAYATRAYGRIYSDYISTLGAYYFKQNPASAQISADRNHVALSNQVAADNTSNYTVCGIRNISAGLLRNVKKGYMTITDDATGKVVWSKEVNNQRKSFSSGSNIYGSSFDVEFNVDEENLKNNTSYTFKLVTYIDYGTEAEQDKANVKNVYEFPFYVDFEAPVITGVKYRDEYDKYTKKHKLYADVSLYDNHYAMALQFGQVTRSAEDESKLTLESFGEYMTPVYSSYNSTSVITFELTDYIAQIKEKSVGLVYDEASKQQVAKKNNAFVITAYDYAMNAATYELSLPEEVAAMYFADSDGKKIEELELRLNETKNIADLVKIYPDETWSQMLDFEYDKTTGIIDIVNNYIIAKKGGETILTAKGLDKNGNVVQASLKITVDDTKKYDEPGVNQFALTGYDTIFAYYSLDNDDKEIGVTGGSYEFGKNLSLSMYPNEQVKLNYVLRTYFPEENAKVKFTVASGKENVSIDETGKIVALNKGVALIRAEVYKVNDDGTEKRMSSTASVTVTVKEPFKTQSIYLMSYKGVGGEVLIPGNKGITTIYQYAFSNYEYVEKDLNNGDVVTKEDPLYIKPQYIGDAKYPEGVEKITKIIIPKGVTDIQKYAFAGLTELKEVVFEENEKSINIGVGAFEGCVKLEKVTLSTKNGPITGGIKFINKDAFKGCVGLRSYDFTGVVAIGDYSFSKTDLSVVKLPSTTQSVGIGAFMNNSSLYKVDFGAKKMKIGEGAFAYCDDIEEITLNCAVISRNIFNSLLSDSNGNIVSKSALKTVTLGKDVEVISEYAFAGCEKLENIIIDSGNNSFVAENGYIYDKVNGNKGSTLITVAPAKIGTRVTLSSNVTKIAKGAFNGIAKLQVIKAPSVTEIDDYAFSLCINLKVATFGKLKTIGVSAFSRTALTALPSDTSELETIGENAFYGTKLNAVDLSANDGLVIGDYAFAACSELATVKLGNNVTIGAYAFASPFTDYSYSKTQNFNNYKVFTYEYVDVDGTVKQNSYRVYDFYKNAASSLTSVEVGENAKIGEYAFMYNVVLTNALFGEGAQIGDYAFMACAALGNVDLSKVVSIGDYAFSGRRMNAYWLKDGVYNYAYVFEVINGELVATDYYYTSLAPSFEEVTLPDGVKLGKGAFAFTDKLKAVTLGGTVLGKDGETYVENLVPEEAFAYATALKTFDFSKITAIKSYAFARTAFTALDLKSVETIGSFAFMRTLAEEVTLNDTASSIGDGAFINANKLAKIDNLGKAEYIGANAFVRAAFESADLTNAKIVGDLAFAKSGVTSVKFGDNLTEIGENPFYDCKIETYGRFEPVDGFETVEKLKLDYKISNTVFVQGGAIYKVAQNGGSVLVSYPLLAEETEFIVADGTVRISAYAFSGAKLTNVTLPETLLSIGSKAFYACNNLTTVNFLSLNAPKLEEEYDTSILTFSNMPGPGKYGTYDTLGISKFTMWNVTGRYNNFYFGANFVDYVGHITHKLVMVMPENGKNYDSFIYGQYFGSKIIGNNAATESTKSVIALIDEIPDRITLDESVIAKVESARKAYDAITDLTQKSLIRNFGKLTGAETNIERLRAGQQSSSSDSSSSAQSESAPVALFIVLGVLLVSCAAAAVVFVLRKKKNK